MTEKPRGYINQSYLVYTVKTRRVPVYLPDEGWAPILVMAIPIALMIAVPVIAVVAALL